MGVMGCMYIHIYNTCTEGHMGTYRVEGGLDGYWGLLEVGVERMSRDNRKSKRCSVLGLVIGE